MDNLLDEREHAREAARVATTEVVKGIENCVLTVLYIDKKINDSKSTPEKTIVQGVKALYDERFDEEDVRAALDNLRRYGCVDEYQRESPNPASYSLTEDCRVEPVQIRFRK